MGALTSRLSFGSMLFTMLRGQSWEPFVAGGLGRLLREGYDEARFRRPFGAASWSFPLCLRSRPDDARALAKECWKECLSLAARRLRATRWVMLLLFCSACEGRGHWLVVVLFRLRWARPLAFAMRFSFTVALSTRLRQLLARWCGRLCARNAVLSCSWTLLVSVGCTGFGP